MTVVDLYTLQIVRDPDPPSVYCAATTRELVEETEENLTDLLPAGYRARIRRWDHPSAEEIVEFDLIQKRNEEGNPDE